jgi:hypothetical protein
MKRTKRHCSSPASTQIRTSLVLGSTAPVAAQVYIYFSFMQHLLQARGQPMYHFLHRFCFYMSHDSRPDNGTVRDKLDTFSVQVFFDAKLRPWTILQVGFLTCTVGRSEHSHQLLGVCSWRQGLTRGKVSCTCLRGLQQERRQDLMFTCYLYC